MRPGVRIGVDVGSVRIGVARSDATATLAVPVTTVSRGPGDIAALAGLVAEHEAIEVVVGLPLAMSGRPGPAAQAARLFARELAAALGPAVPVRLVDERLTTVSATRNLREAGRRSRNSRAVVDQAAAVVIVTYALDRERATGAPTGELVQES
jgi:putative Holliday junction resolvase